MLKSRDISKLRPDVAANCRTFLALCAAEGLPVLVTETVRDLEYQASLYAQGRTKPGSIVTNQKTPSFHWEKVGLAFDICKNVKGHEYDDAAFFRRCGAIGKKMGFTWGGDWKSIVDLPHFQWDDGGKYTAAMVRKGKLPRTMPRYEKEEIMTDKEIYDAVQRHAATLKVPSVMAEEYQRAVDAGITDGKNPMQLVPKYQAAVMAMRAAKKAAQ